MADISFRQVIVGADGVPPLSDFSFVDIDGQQRFLGDNVEEYGACTALNCREQLVSLHEKENEHTKGGKHLGYGCLNDQCWWLTGHGKRYACVDVENKRLDEIPNDNDPSP